MTTSKDPAIVRAIIEDRMDQLTCAPIVGPDSGAEIEVSPLWRQIGADLHEVAARVAGNEVGPFGMRDLVEGLEDTIRERVVEWAIAYTLGEQEALAS